MCSPGTLEMHSRWEDVTWNVSRTSAGLFASMTDTRLLLCVVVQIHTKDDICSLSMSFTSFSCSWKFNGTRFQVLFHSTTLGVFFFCFFFCKQEQTFEFITRTEKLFRPHNAFTRLQLLIKLIHVIFRLRRFVLRRNIWVENARTDNRASIARFTACEIHSSSAPNLQQKRTCCQKV